MHQIWLPLTFFEDHEGRDLPSGTVIKRAARKVLVQCSDDELSEIESDAKYYADLCGPDGEGLEGIRRSAKATVEAIKKHRAAA